MSYETPDNEAEKGHKIQIVAKLGELAPVAYALQTEVSTVGYPFLSIASTLRTYEFAKPSATAEASFDAFKDAIIATAELHYIKIPS